MTKVMSEEWKNLDTKKKKKFEDMAAKDKERYESEKASSAPTKAGKNAVKKAEPEGLKRPLSAYFLFQEERRESIKKENPTMSHKELVQAMGQEWNTMDSKKKEKFEKKAKELKQAYDSERAKLSGNGSTAK